VVQGMSMAGLCTKDRNIWEWRGDGVMRGGGQERAQCRGTRLAIVK